MGCDIHAVIEYRSDASARWERDDSELPRALDGRDYRVFSVLAGVRQRDDLPVIDEPRGLPVDFVPRGRGEGIDPYLDDHPWSDPDLHSTSWMSLADLEGFDWDQTVAGWLIVEEADYLKWRDGDRKHPECGCRGTSRPVYTDAEYRDLEARGLLPSGRDVPLRDRPMVHVEWSERLRDVMPALAVDTIEHLRKLGSPNDVRIVFGFDN